MTKLPALLCALAAITGCETMYQAPPQTPVQTEPPEEVVPDPRVETVEPVNFAEPPDTTPTVAPSPDREFARPPAVAPVAPRFVPAPRKRIVRPPVTDRDPCPACGMG